VGEVEDRVDDQKVDDEKDEVEVEDEVKKEDDDAGDKTDADDDTGDEDNSAGKDADADDGDGFSTDLLSRAEEAGFDEEEAREFGSPANLEKTLVRVDSRMAEVGRAAIEAAKPDKDEDEDEDDEPRRPARGRRKSGKSRREKDDEPEYDPGIDDDLSPGVGKALKDLQKRHAASLAERDDVIAEMRERVDEVMDERKAEKMDAVKVQIDRAFDAMPKEWQEIFGDGDVRQGTKEWDNRIKVLGTAEAMAHSIKVGGGRVPTEKNLILRAAHVDFGKHAKKLTRQSLTEKAKKRSSQITSRATSRKQSPKKGIEAAIALAEKFSKEQENES